jgi:hypothetical protein
MKLIAMVPLLAIAAGCSDAVTERYATVEGARKAGLFERGWLPDILPPSTHDIETRSDLDLNVSAGEFFLSKGDLKSFTDRLDPYLGEAVGADVHLASYLQAKKKEGMRAGVFKESSAIWAFVCDPQTARCTYSVALER